MSTTELRAMAQRLTSNNQDYWFAIDHLPDAAKDARPLARHILATTADDDDEPVTVERLIAAGGEQIDDEIVRFNVKPFEVFVWSDGTFNLGDAEQRAPVRNMGHVRALLAALVVG